MSFRSLLTGSSSAFRPATRAASSALRTSSSSCCYQSPALSFFQSNPSQLIMPAAASSNQLLGISCGGGVQSRRYWQEVVRGTVDPRDGRNRYEDPENAAARSARAQNSEGLLRRRWRYQRYEKPWMKKKRLKNEKIYRNKERGVEELKMYIQFMKENSAASAAGGDDDKGR